MLFLFHYNYFDCFLQFIFAEYALIVARIENNLIKIYLILDIRTEGH